MRGALLMALLALFSFSAEAAAVHAQGNKLFYRGRELFLQGVSVGDPLMSRLNRPMDDYSYIAQDWNANAIRFSIHPSTWREAGRRRALDELVKHVYAALDSGLFVIIDWHAIGIPNGYYQEAPSGLLTDVYDTDFRLAKDFWEHMAWEFGKEGRIIFEMWNEPVFPAPPENGENRWLALRPYWEELAAFIRENGGENLLIASGPAWSYDLSGIRNAPLSDPNVAYAWHIYADTDGDNPTLWAANLDGLDAIHPVIVTEWGFDPQNAKHHGTADSFGKPFRILFLQGRNLSHLAWCWHPEWTPHMLENDWRTPTPYGGFVKETLWMTPREKLVRPVKEP